MVAGLIAQLVAVETVTVDWVYFANQSECTAAVWIAQLMVAPAAPWTQRLAIQSESMAVEPAALMG